MLQRKPLIISVAIIVLVPILAVAWWLLSPLLTSTTVDEELPFSTNAVVPAGMTPMEVEGIMAGMAKVDQTVAEAMPEAMMDPAEALLLKSGQFRDADRFHQGSGRASIYRGPDGSYLLRLEDFRVTNGPDLRVLLSPHANPESGDDVKTSGYVDLGKIKGNIGNQNYDIPAGLDPESQGSVVIYCAPFHVIFSVAPLADSG